MPRRRTTTTSLSASQRLLVPHEDERGDVREIWRASWGVPPIVQMNRTFSRRGVIRGMHYHREQWDVWHFTAGLALVLLYDPESAQLSFFIGKSSHSIVIPPRLAHGFQALTDCTLIYGFTAEFDGSDELGFYPLADWPGARLWEDQRIISERDRSAPKLAEFLVSHAVRTAAEGVVERYGKVLEKLE